MSTNPQRIGRYDIVEPIGIGGMSTVYRAVDPVLKRDVALKLLTHGSADSHERFLREARVLGTLDQRLDQGGGVLCRDVAQRDDGEAEARGDSAQAVIQAAGRAEAIRREQLSLTPLYIDYIKIQKWSGQVPTTVAGNSGLMIQLPKDSKE